MSNKELWVLANAKRQRILIQTLFQLLRRGARLETSQEMNALCSAIHAKIPCLVGIEEQGRGLVFHTSEGYALLLVGVNDAGDLILALEDGVNLA